MILELVEVSMKYIRELTIGGIVEIEANFQLNWSIAII